ncbi:choice-of-anchor P family protein [Amycolatopsis aidingensis]|uniref:choice-of-anchor P family protein n=1 Tax=Amycolatopsis aidingensis TaxID=2842453 RepID=UPI001C0AC7A3|nr:choice-of-anchor P family protein [Amycolatopsis aidingensis]
MSKKRTAAALGAGALSLLLVGGLAPHAAATEAEDSAYAIAASKLVTIPKTPHVVGSGKESLVAADLPPGEMPLLHTGVLNAEAEQGYAKASVAELKLDLPALPISAEKIVAKCDDLTGSIALATVQIGPKKITLGEHIKPNTTIGVEGLATVTLNKQTENEDGSLTVTAISVKVLDKLQRVDISSATCTKKQGGQEPSETTGPSEPSETTGPSEPSETTSPTKPGDNGDNGDDGDDDLPGDEADENGNAPQPTPQPGHLDVTG